MTDPADGTHLELDEAWSAETVAVQAGRPVRAGGAPMNAAITMTSTYVHDAAIEYGRDGNPGWAALETALGALDGGRAVTFASGLAAATAIASLVPAGGTVALSTSTSNNASSMMRSLDWSSPVVSVSRIRTRTTGPSA